MDISKLIRPYLKNFTPYSCARDEYSGKAEIWLDANENPYNNGVNRYPDPYQKALKLQISVLKKVNPNHIFLGNGSDEAIDLLIRIFCEPGKDRILIFPPTYGMYAVAAKANNVEVDEILLTENFQLNVEQILNYPKKAKLLFICSPNNPTGNLIKREDIIKVLENFKGIVVIDEAYFDFTQGYESFSTEIETFDNLVVLQTFSKAWGMAGARLGICYANEEIVGYMNKVKLPYNVNTLTVNMVSNKIETFYHGFTTQVKTIIKEREKLKKELKKINIIKKVHPSDANFLLVQVENPIDVYQKLQQKGIIVRNRSNLPLCEGCLRITIGTPEENKILLETLKQL